MLLAREVWRDSMYNTTIDIMPFRIVLSKTGNLPARYSAKKVNLIYRIA